MLTFAVSFLKRSSLLPELLLPSGGYRQHQSQAGLQGPLLLISQSVLLNLKSFFVEKKTR
jgi:hypothetical protein